MQSLIQKGRAFLTPSQSSTNINKQGFQTAKSPTRLFPTVDPAIDGEDCLHDCNSCSITLPRKWEIDEEDTLYGHVKGWDTHVIVATGKTDWVRDIADEKGSLMEKIEKRGLSVKNGNIRLSASDMPTGNSWDSDTSHDSTYSHDGKTRCLVLPKWTMVEGVSAKEVDWFLDEVVGKSATNLSPLKFKSSELEKVDLSSTNSQAQSQNDSSESKTTSDGTETPTEDLSAMTISSSQNRPLPSLTPPNDVTLRQCGHRALILMCSHKTRDWRCGASAPLLRREFERHLRPLGLYRDIHDERPGGVGIYFINHVGGHKYSANVMIYRREISKKTIKNDNSSNNTIDNGDVTTATTQDDKEELSDEAIQGIWLARVRPEDCENIVKYTVLQGKVVKPQRQLRGGFNRENCLMSW